MKMFKAVLVSFVLSFLSAAALAEPVDINTADAKTLDAQLQGVGPKSAEAIVAYRTKHGPFKRAEDLDKVKGIGKKTVEKNRANIVVGGVK